MEIKSKLWIEVDGEPVFGRGRRFLLQAIDQYGSINQAAKEINISYRKAWGYIKAMEERLGIKLVEWQAGGKNGGGALLTKEARGFLKNYEAMEEGIREIVDKKFGKIFKNKTQQVLWDMSGAFGDIGVLFPIAIALIVKNGFNPTALFLMAGLFYITSAYYFKITMPVQPLKAMAAIAIASGLSYEVINAAGIVMGIILFLLAFSGLSAKLGNLFPVSVIRGIQLGLGIMLVKASLNLIQGEVYIAVFAGALLIASIFLIKKMPPLIPLLIIGIFFSLNGINLSTIGPVALKPDMPDIDALWKGFTILVLPQIALTFGNAIVATEATGKLLYGKKAERLNLKSVPVSMGIANISSGIIGGAPMCHGCGGLTAHSKFGATSERSGYIIGFALIVIALLFGRSALAMVSAFPAGILGVLLCYVGIQHSLFIKDIMGDRKAMLIAVTVGISGFMTNNLSVGFLLGLGMHYSLLGIIKTLKYFERQ